MTFGEETQAGEKANMHSVRAIIVNYNSRTEEMENLLTSLKGQTIPVNVMVVDNASEEKSGLKAAEEMGAQILKLPSNTGFACAVNAGAQKASEDFLLILNFDVVLKEDAVQRMIEEIQNKPACIAVCPKILLQEHPQFLDAVGTGVDAHFQAFNRGCGEPDIGQYEVPERVSGACFATVLIKREPFLALGGLDASYFLYYEDIDFSVRAYRKGYEIYTCPSARVYHHHSASLRSAPPEFKQYSIRRNLLKTASKNLTLTDFFRVWFYHLNLFFLRRFSGLTLLDKGWILLESLMEFPILYFRGRKWGKRVRLKDLATSNPQTFLNASTYEPLRSLESFVYALERLCEISPTEENLRERRKWRALLARRYTLPGKTLYHLLYSLKQREFWGHLL